jgi:hypothetical protein
MRYVSFLLLILTISTARAEIFDGVYVQQPRKVELSDTDDALKYNEIYERDKITLIVKGDELTISMFNGADAATLPIVKYGRTLVATDQDMYWVLYQEDKDNLHSSGMHFIRIGDVSP